MDISEELKPPVTPEEVVRVEEGFPGRQTVISMAFDTGVSPKDPEFPVLLFLDGLLGGFPHSKIFSVVREKENLAYFADTIVDAWRGLVIAIAGISDRDKDRVEDLIASQMDVLRHGDISDEEMDNTRKGLIRRLRTEADYQGTIINRMLNHEILGGARTGEEIVGDVSKVTKDDVIDVYKRQVLDLACGTGNMAIRLAKRGYKVTGVDSSKDMLDVARDKAAREGLCLSFVQQDMRYLESEKQFDAAVCLFDSLNYLLEPVSYTHLDVYKRQGWNQVFHGHSCGSRPLSENGRIRGCG